MFTVADAIELSNRPGLQAASIHRSLYVRLQRGDIPAKTVIQNGKPTFDLSLDSVCAFAVLHTFGRMGNSSGSPVSEAAKAAMFNWTGVGPDLSKTFKTPLSWAIAEIRAASSQMLISIYLAHDSVEGEDVIVASVFPADDPQIPQSEIARASLCLNDLLAPIIGAADALQSKKSGVRVQ